MSDKTKDKTRNVKVSRYHGITLSPIVVSVYITWCVNSEYQRPHVNRGSALSMAEGAVGRDSTHVEGWRAFLRRGQRFFQIDFKSCRAWTEHVSSMIQYVRNNVSWNVFDAVLHSFNFGALARQVGGRTFVVRSYVYWIAWKRCARGKVQFMAFQIAQHEVAARTTRN